MTRACQSAGSTRLPSSPCPLFGGRWGVPTCAHAANAACHGPIALSMRRRRAPVRQVHLFLNAGDHAHMVVAFTEALAEMQLPYDTVSTASVRVHAHASHIYDAIHGDGAPRTCTWCHACRGVADSRCRSPRTTPWLSERDHAASECEHTTSSGLTRASRLAPQVDSMDGVNAFAKALRSGTPPKSAVTLFAFKEYFPAVATTDVLSRVTDFLCCKPSELAFYPVPKVRAAAVGTARGECYSRAWAIRGRAWRVCIAGPCVADRLVYPVLGFICALCVFTVDDPSCGRSRGALCWPRVGNGRRHAGAARGARGVGVRGKDRGVTRFADDDVWVHRQEQAGRHLRRL